MVVINHQRIYRHDIEGICVEIFITIHNFVKSAIRLFNKPLLQSLKSQVNSLNNQYFPRVSIEKPRESIEHCREKLLLKTLCVLKNLFNVGKIIYLIFIGYISSTLTLLREYLRFILFNIEFRYLQNISQDRYFNSLSNTKKVWLYSTCNNMFETNEYYFQFQSLTYVDSNDCAFVKKKKQLINIL